MNPSPVISSTGGLIGSSCQRPSPTHPIVPLRTLPHSSIKVYKNGQLIGKLFKDANKVTFAEYKYAYDTTGLMTQQIEYGFFDGQSEQNLTTIRSDLQWTNLDEIRVCKRIPVDKRHNAKIDYPALYEMLKETC